MLTLNIDRLSETPIYEQLYLFIKKEITEGHISYGSKLPSKRKLSDFLKVSQNTVEAAYEQLVAEGYVEGIPRKGYFVLAYEDLEYVQASANVLTEEEKPPGKYKYKYNFHPSWIDTKNFPFAKWRKYAKNTIDDENRSLLLLGEQQGEYELRKEIASYLYQARGVHCTPEEVVVGAGIEVLLQQLIMILHKNTVYGIEDPGYDVISRLLKSFPNEVYPLEVDEEGVKVENIDSLPISAVYVTPSHHFPFGATLSVNRRIKLLNWASAAENRYIIEDDYDSEFRYTGKSIPSLKSMDQGDRVIYLGTFSKSLIPSLRISYMVMPKKLLKRYKEELSFYHSSVSRIDQHILAQFMKSGDFERHLNRMRKIYRRKLEKTLEALKPYQPFVKIIGANTGFHIVLAVENGMDEQELVAIAEENRIKVYPLSAYSMEKREDYPPKIILGFGGISEDEIGKAIHHLLKCWQIERAAE